MAHIDRDRKSIVGERNKLQATIAKFFRVQAKAVASQVIDLITCQAGNSSKFLVRLL